VTTAVVKLRTFPLVVASAFAISALGCAFGPYTAPSTQYGYTNDRGPEFWGQLSPEFALCSEGKQQSPIDVGELTPTEPDSVVVHYQPTGMHIRRDQHTIRLDIDPGSFVELDGTKYALKELHFHRISGHAINGRQYPLEAHLVHESRRGKLLIISALIKYGHPNWQLIAIIRVSPKEAGGEFHDPEMQLGIDKFIKGPKSKALQFYRYQGSLTVPPCTEGVQWLVMKNILDAHRVQQYAFRKLAPGNYRPMQPQNDRPVSLLPEATD
jgi:carbonic anhydrase